MLQEHYLLLLGHECEVNLSKSTSRRRPNTLGTESDTDYTSSSHITMPRAGKLHPKREKLPGPFVIVSKICISFDDECVQSQ